MKDAAEEMREVNETTLRQIQEQLDALTERVRELESPERLVSRVAREMQKLGRDIEKQAVTLNVPGGPFKPRRQP